MARTDHLPRPLPDGYRPTCPKDGEPLQGSWRSRTDMGCLTSLPDPPANLAVENATLPLSQCVGCFCPSVLRGCEVLDPPNSHLVDGLNAPPHEHGASGR